MDITSLAAALESLKIVAGVARATSAAAVDHQIKGRLIEIQQGILDVQAQLGDATEERLRLLGQVSELRQQLRDIENAKAALESYELNEVSPGLLLFKSRKDAGHTVDHFACPQCHNAGRVSVLQRTQAGSQRVRYDCAAPSCKFAMYVGPADPQQPIRYTNRGRV